MFESIILTGQVYSGRSWVKLDGSLGLNCLVQTNENGRSKRLKLEGPRGETGRSQETTVEGREDKKTGRS